MGRTKWNQKSWYILLNLYELVLWWTDSSPSCVVLVTEATDFGWNKIASVSAANAAGCANGWPQVYSKLTWSFRLCEIGCLLLGSFVITTVEMENYRGWSEDNSLLKEVAFRWSEKQLQQPNIASGCTSGMAGENPSETQAYELE